MVGVCRVGADVGTAVGVGDVAAVGVACAELHAVGTGARALVGAAAASIGIGGVAVQDAAANSELATPAIASLRSLRRPTSLGALIPALTSVDVAVGAITR